MSASPLPPARTAPPATAARLALLLAGLALAACGPAANGAPIPPPAARAPTASASAAPAPAVRVAFTIPRDGAPLDVRRAPWPTEMARLPDGHLDLRAYPGRAAPLFADYFTRAAEDLDGFSTSPVLYFRFEGPIDLHDVPEADTSRSAASAIGLADVDPSSPEKGTFYPLAFRATHRDMRFIAAGTLAARPPSGITLRPRTLYAAFIRRGFGHIAGGLRTSPDLDAVLSRAPRADPTEERARLLHADAVAALEKLGVPRADIASLAVFRTGAPDALAAGLIDLADRLMTAPPPPRQRGAKKAANTPAEGSALPPRILTADWDPQRSEAGLYRVVRGAYCTPNIQSRIENAPFIEREGGRVLQDPSGRPLTSPVPASAPFAAPECPGQLRARFVLSVPDAPMPEGGYPLLVSAHGTGGDAFTHLGRDDHAGWAASEGFATVATDQPMNGGADSGRPGAAGPLLLPLGIPLPPGNAGPEIAFYNPLYPGAARGNLHQAMMDAAVLVRLFGGLDLATLRGPSGRPLLRAARGQIAPRFDPRRTVLAGHSQGCQSIEVLGAVDPRARGVILSGCGGDLRLGILNQRLINVPSYLTLLLGLDPEEISSFHPLMALVQSLADPVDPITFARRYWDPLPGRAPQRVLHIQGLRDSYSPDAAAEALAVALRARPLSPLPRPIRELDLAPAPSSSDRLILQLSSTTGHDGHFVLYHEPAAADALRAFLRASPSR